DISHVLASIFKDLYTKDIIWSDTLSNLIKTKYGRSRYHERYVEELQQAQSVYHQCIKEADMLESHIIQARARAAAAEKQAYERMVEKMGDVADYQGLLTESAFCWCMDNDLLKRHKLISPLDKPRDGQRFLRNPHLLPPIAQQVGGSLISPRIKVGKVENLRKRMEDVFQAKPSVVSFTDYTVGNVYETTLQLQNLTSASRHVRVSPPTTPYFSVRFPGEDGVIAPGMSCKYIVRFAPDSLGDYEDFITVETEVEHLLVVPIVATRAPPVLTPRVLDCGFCLIGGVKCVEFQCQNVGFSAGTFWIIPKNQWPPSNLRSVARTYFCEQPPFAIGPSQFALQPGEALVIVFFPTAVEKSSKVFTIMCDNSQVKDITIEPVGGEALDLTAEHIVHFSRCNPHFVQQKKLIVRNNHLELPFYWQIRKPNLRSLLPGETPKPSHIQFHLATHDAFQVSPVTGVLAPCQEQEFLLTFCPKELKDYHSVCNLVLSDVKDVTAMEIEVKGSTEPYQVLLEPYAIVIPGEVFIFTTIHRQFKMWNHSKTCIFFQWERMSGNSHTIEVMPRTGRIENECFDFDLMVTGERPERVVTSLVCHIEHYHKSVTLPVKVSFKGPIVTVSVPSVDFGLIRLGEQGRASLCLTNITHLEASWMLKEMQHLLVRGDVQSPLVCLLNCKLILSELYIGVPANATVTLINQTLLPSYFSWLQGEHSKLCTASFEPSSGTLGPNKSLDITVNFISQGHLELTDVAALCEVEGMSSPLVLSILAPKAKKLSVLYSLPNVPSTLLIDFGDDVILMRAVTKQLLITNQTAIPAPFTIEAEYFTCSASKSNGFTSSLLAHGKGAAFFVSPDSGMLGPFETQTVDVTAYTDMWGEYRDHLICKVGDLEATLVPMQMIVKGCPLYFQLTGPRPNCQNQGPIIFGTHVSGGDTVARCLRINNPTEFRPHVGSLSDYPYCITPQQMVIPAKGSSTIRVSFTPLTLSESVFESRCVGLALGFMSLNTELAACVPGKVVRAQGLNLEPVRMDLLAGVKPALSVQMEDDERVLEFRASAGDLLKRESEQEVNVAFHCSPSLLDHTDQADEEVMPGVTLIHSASGQRKLRFEQNLQIHYSNNSLQQSVPLRAHLDLATMRLSTYSIDFGCCYVGQTLTAGVNLYSHGAHTYWKSLISRDSHVFRVDPEVGFLMYNKLLATGCRQCLQISFTPEDKEFQSTVVIRSPLVKTPLTLQLQGTGS
uniref:Deleted in lung and esophageal cancer protein 1 Ig-like domain-containing protein n=1 Tax=Mola mola TaxID=94237 RepID=A0A3Q3W7F0_MOLML